jgi:hypothetical protein
MDHDASTCMAFKALKKQAMATVSPLQGFDSGMEMGKSD